MYRRHLCKCDRHCVVVNDNQFIARTSRKEICGDRDSRSGVAYDIDANKVGYIITRPNKEIEITYFKPTMEVNNVNDFVAFVETFKQAKAKYSYYSYYDWVQDIIRMKEGLEHIIVDDDEFIFARDDEFIRTTSDAQINKTGYNGLVYELHEDGDKVGYIVTYPNKRTKVIRFKPKMKIRNPNDFVNLVKTFKQTCSKHKNYNYYNLSRDIMEDVTTENEGPIKEIVINGNNMGTRMYYYKNKEAVVKVGTASVVLRRGRDKYDSSIKFENVNDFTAFVEGIIPYCTANNLNFNNYINSNDMLQHFELQKKITHRGKFLNNAKVLATSFCYPGNAALAYYDNKTTMLITVEKFMKDFVGGSDVPVKLDEDLQTAEEFQNWVSDHVNPYCQEHKIGYFKFVKRLNKQYDEKHKDDLLALQLDEAQIELVNREYDKSISDVGMNAKPNHDNDHKLDDTGIVGKILSQLENDKQLDRLAGTPNNKENGGRQ